MSAEVYLPYHRKFRPKAYSEYVGNDRLKKSGMAALRGSSKPQVLLFQGPAGCGKTTMARLMAKEYRCENRDDFTGACGKCDSCRDLEEYIESGDSGSLMNLREVDVTDSNKKQDIDELLEDAAQPAFDGGWKIYILDECHVMSNAAQNRLLKNLEEPAENVLMILCTTDPEKLLGTILSRCQYTFKVVKPSRDELANLLARVCKQENVKFEPRALSLVCVKGDFVPRKALVALEQVVREKQEVTYNNTVEVLNIVADKYFFDFYGMLLSESINIYRYITFLGNLKNDMDLKQFLDTLTAFTMRGLYISNGVLVEAMDKSEIDQYKKLFNKFNVGDVAYLLDLLLGMKNSVDIEAKLLLLGYTGLKRVATVPSVTVDTLVDPTEFNTAQEKREGDANFQGSITMSEEEKVDFVAERSQNVDVDFLAQHFQGTKINPEQ
jgi:DNA polymerase-3 subunit gamma/tau